MEGERERVKGGGVNWISLEERDMRKKKEQMMI
jgi:hypothetical protein